MLSGTSDVKALKTIGVIVLLLSLLSGCGDSSTSPVPVEPRLVEGVDFNELFAEPRSAEIGSVLQEWGARDVSAQDVQVETTTDVTAGGSQFEVRIVSHTVDGVRHYGAVITPDRAEAGSLPVIVYCHGDDNGESVDFVLQFLPYALDERLDDFVYVIPSFRSETLRYRGVTYQSEGDPSPWDRDVDDVIALLNVALAETPEADPTRIGAIGFSRGGGVAMLMAIRDPRIDLVVEFFGPTDFFGPFVQQVTEEALLGNPRDLPGLDYLDQAFIQPLKDSLLTTANVRMEMLRRSPVYFAERLPPLQVHHGTADDVVPVGEAERLIEVMQDLGRGEPEFEYYLYPGQGHSPIGFTSGFERTRAFLSHLIQPSLIAATVP